MKCWWLFLPSLIIYLKSSWEGDPAGSTRHYRHPVLRYVASLRRLCRLSLLRSSRVLGTQSRRPSSFNGLKTIRHRSASPWVLNPRVSAIVTAPPPARPLLPCVLMLSPSGKEIETTAVQNNADSEIGAICCTSTRRWSNKKCTSPKGIRDHHIPRPASHHCLARTPLP